MLPLLCRAMVLTAALSSTSALAAGFQDVLVQAPTLGAPERGSVSGQLASLSYGPADECTASTPRARRRC